MKQGKPAGAGLTAALSAAGPPIMLPLAEEIGMNELHLRIFLVTALGLNLFVLSGLTGQPALTIVLPLALVPALSLWTY